MQLIRGCLETVSSLLELDTADGAQVVIHNKHGTQIQAQFESNHFH